jgi:glycosyltransferase involved in cell wall biosynthesis
MISFAITTHNEGQYIQDLLDQLLPHCKQTGDEIVIVDDYSTDEHTSEILADALRHGVTVRYHPLERDFARHKNYLNSLCNGDYIFQVDADEKFHSTLLTYMHDIVYNNTSIDLFLIPRVNIVNGLTDDDIKRWGWRVNDMGWVMFPDYQTRLYKNNTVIHWEGKVHERIVGHKMMTSLPPEEDWALYHIKEIDRQRQQNSYYATISN